MVTFPTISLDFEILEVAPDIFRNCYQGHLFPFLFIFLSNVKALPGSHLMILAYHYLLSKFCFFFFLNIFCYYLSETIYS